jgi:hypothetical protein
MKAMRGFCSCERLSRIIVEMMRVRAKKTYWQTRGPFVIEARVSQRPSIEHAEASPSSQKRQQNFCDGPGSPPIRIRLHPPLLLSAPSIPDHAFMPRSMQSSRQLLQSSTCYCISFQVSIESSDYDTRKVIHSIFKLFDRMNPHEFRLGRENARWSQWMSLLSMLTRS